MIFIIVVEGSADTADKRVIELSWRTWLSEVLFNTTSGKFNMKCFIMRMTEGGGGSSLHAGVLLQPFLYRLNKVGTRGRLVQSDITTARQQNIRKVLTKPDLERLC